MITSPVALLLRFAAGGSRWEPVPQSFIIPSVTAGPYAPSLTPSNPTIAAFAADPFLYQQVGGIVSVWGNLVVTWPGYVAGLVTEQIVADLPILPPFPNLGAAGAVAPGDVGTGIPYTAGTVSIAGTSVSLSFATLDGAPQYVGLSFAYRLA